LTSNVSKKPWGRGVGGVEVGHLHRQSNQKGTAKKN